MSVPLCLSFHHNSKNMLRVKMVPLTLFFILTVLSQVDAFSFGAPMSTCFTQYPKHNTATQSLSCSPIKITLSPSTYTPGGTPVTVTVIDNSGEMMRGIEMAARRLTDNKEEIVGQFQDFDGNKLKVFNCFSGVQNMITHRNNDQVANFTFKWVPPSNNVGDVVFRSTVLRNYDVFWYDVLTELPIDGSTVLPLTPSVNPPLPLCAPSDDIDLSGCGDSKGCFLYPCHCSGEDCIAAATFEYDGSNNQHPYKFELYANYDVDYISLGFSDDIWMGQDWTVSCTGRLGKLSVQEGYNPGYFNERRYDLFAASREVMYKNGKLQCRFRLPETFDSYVVNQGPTVNYTYKSWDLSKDYHLMLAWGDAMADSSVLAHHHDLPAVSYSKVDLKSTDKFCSSAYHVLVRAHGAVMIIAWVLLTGIVTFISRHYRDWLPRTRLCGTKVWFQIHRGLAILVAVLTGVGLLLIFVHYGSGIREYAEPHAYVGLVVTACVGLQIIAGMLRPDGDSKMRPVFNWAHRFLGQASHILAAATMFTAFDIRYVNPDMKFFGFVALSSWVAFQVLWHLGFEGIRQWHKRMQGRYDHYTLDSNGSKAEGNQVNDSHIYSIIFGIYVFCLICFCLAILFAFLFY